MKLYFSNKSNSNSNIDNLYKNKKYDRTQKKKEKKKLPLKKKKTRVDNRGFGFWVEIFTNHFFFFYCTWQIKHLYFFGEKSKMQTMSSSLENDKFLFAMLYINLLNLVWF